MRRVTCFRLPLDTVTLRRFMAMCLGPALFCSSVLATGPEFKVECAVSCGLAFVARQQTEDGSFDGGGPKVANTGLALTCFLASGNTQDVGRYGLTVRRAVDYLLRVQPHDGYFGSADGSHMYGQAIATIALAEAYGTEADPTQRAKIRSAVERAVDVILKAEDVTKAPAQAGGWRDEPQSTDSDLSLTAWNILALRAAKDIGADVPDVNLSLALAYVLRCYRSDLGGFAAQPGGDVSASVTAAGVVAVSLLDVPQRPEAQACSKVLGQPPLADQQGRNAYYTRYYVAQAAYQLGDSVWNAVWPAMRDQLLAQQAKDGGWPCSNDSEQPGRTYATSMSLLTLCVPMRMLPMYQK